MPRGQKVKTAGHESYVPYPRESHLGVPHGNERRASIVRTYGNCICKIPGMRGFLAGGYGNATSGGAGFNNGFPAEYTFPSEWFEHQWRFYLDREDNVYGPNGYDAFSSIQELSPPSTNPTPAPTTNSADPDALDPYPFNNAPVPGLDFGPQFVFFMGHEHMQSGSRDGDDNFVVEADSYFTNQVNDDLYFNNMLNRFMTYDVESYLAGGFKLHSEIYNGDQSQNFSWYSTQPEDPGDWTGDDVVTSGAGTGPVNNQQFGAVPDFAKVMCSGWGVMNAYEEDNMVEMVRCLVYRDYSSESSGAQNHDSMLQLIRFQYGRGIQLSGAAGFGQDLYLDDPNPMPGAWPLHRARFTRLESQKFHLLTDEPFEIPFPGQKPGDIIPAPSTNSTWTYPTEICVVFAYSPFPSAEGQSIGKLIREWWETLTGIDIGAEAAREFFRDGQIDLISDPSNPVVHP